MQDHKWIKGQSYRLERDRDIQFGQMFDDEERPVRRRWYCLHVPPQCESKARAFLRHRGVFTFYPSEERARKNPRGGRKITWERPLVGGLVFSKFSQEPQWDVLKSFSFITGPLCIGTVPAIMGPQTMRRLQGLTYEAELQRLEQIELAERMAAELTEGEQAQIMTGLLKGRAVEIMRLLGGEALIKLLDVANHPKLSVPLRNLRRID